MCRLGPGTRFGGAQFRGKEEGLKASTHRVMYASNNVSVCLSHTRKYTQAHYLSICLSIYLSIDLSLSMYICTVYNIYIIKIYMYILEHVYMMCTHTCAIMCMFAREQLCRGPFACIRRLTFNYTCVDIFICVCVYVRMYTLMAANAVAVFCLIGVFLQVA